MAEREGHGGERETCIDMYEFVCRATSTTRPIKEVENSRDIAS